MFFKMDSGSGKKINFFSHRNIRKEKGININTNLERNREKERREKKTIEFTI